MSASSTNNIQLPPNATMRDVFDYCKKNNIPTVSQGMVELAPPLTLRKLLGKVSLQEEVHQYRDRYGESIYLEGILNITKKQYGFDLERGNIMGVNGVTAGCVTTMMWAKTMGKSRLGLLIPFYTYHLKEVRAVFGCDPVFINTKAEDYFAPDFDEITKALQNGLDILLVCNPANPHGRVWRKDEMDRVVELCRQHNCIVLLDECYCDMVWEPLQHYSPLPPFVPEVPEHVVVVRGFSKNMGCQSWRSAYVIAHKNVIPKLMEQHDPVYVGVPFIQVALGEFLLNHFDEFQAHVKQCGELMQSNWKVLSKALHEALGWEPIEPEGSMYGMFRHHSKTDMDAVKEGLQKGVGVSPGVIFWPNTPENTGHVRIHCGITEEKAKLIVERLKNNQ